MGGPVILKEVEKASKDMEKGIAVGEYETSVKMVEANMIYDTGFIPKKDEFITTRSSPHRKRTCEKHRTMSIISQLRKIILSILRSRIQKNGDN